MNTTQLLYWIGEREAIRVHRANGQPPPWTDDPILREWSFCNIRREDDRVTKWIADRWRAPHADDPDLWFAMCVARFVNWPDALAEFGYPVPWDQERFLAVINGRKARSEVCFGPAYNISNGGSTTPKAEHLAQKVFAPLWRPLTRKRLNKQIEFGERFKLPFAWNPYLPNLFDKGPDNLLRLVSRESKRMREEFSVDLVAVFLDTMGLAACFENENMAAQVQRVVAGLSRVSDETGALCINVDHMSTDQDAGMRGTSAKRDCVETILTCLIDRDRNNKPTNHRMQLFKIRDGEEGRVIPYRLRPVDMGVDEDHTCVVQWELDRPPQSSKQQIARRKTDVTLERAIKEVGLPGDVEVLKAAFYKFHGGTPRTANELGIGRSMGWDLGLWTAS